MAQTDTTSAEPAPLFDFQVNGFAGIDFQSADLSPAQLHFAMERLRAHGVGGLFLTLITDTLRRLEAQFGRLEAMRTRDPLVAQMVRGYHLEGPWLRRQVGFCGAHPLEPMGPPNLLAFERLQAAAGGNIRLVTLAPEWPGSAGFIATLTARRIHVSLGHTDATNAEIDAAIAAGARFCTHLGNGVPAMLNRHDNIIQRLLARDELYACFIPDGIHLPPFVLRNLVRAKPPDRILFTTDAIAAAGAPPGRYHFGRMEITVAADGIVRDSGPSGGFAGSSLAPDQGVALTARFLNLSPAAARRLWSEVPAAAFGVSLAGAHSGATSPVIASASADYAESRADHG